MKSLEEQMAFYAAYHRHPMNKASHFIGVPVIVFAIMGLLDLTRPVVSDPVGVSLGPVPMSLATLVTAVVLVYYSLLDVRLALLMTLVFGALLVGAGALDDAFGAWGLVAVFHSGLFVLGWIVQLLGHGVWEKRRPALVDNLFQVFVAPIFLAAELLFLLGFMKKEHDEVQVLMQAHLPAA